MDLIKKIEALNLIPGIDFKTIFAKSLISNTEKIERQPIAISLGSHAFNGKEYPIPFASYGDISCIIGPSKGQKTYFKNIIEAAYLGGKAELYAGKMLGHNPSQKNLISIDTEQSRYHAQVVKRRTLTMSQTNGNNYYTFALREFTAVERLDFIKELLYNSKIGTNAGLLFIDGYADLVNDFNNLTECNNLVAELMKWSSDLKLCIVGIMHKNYGTAKPVGHLGSALLKKCETVAGIDGTDWKTVSCEYSRNKPFEDYKFKIDQSNGLPKSI